MISSLEVPDSWKDTFERLRPNLERLDGIMTRVSPMTYPSRPEDIFESLDGIDLNNIKVVIVTDEPINPNVGYEHILTEVMRSYPDRPKSSLGESMKSWSEQGVLRISVSLTTHKDLEHKRKFWLGLVKPLCDKIAELNSKMVIIGIGRGVSSVTSALSTNSKTLVITTPYVWYHTFVGCNAFIDCNSHLVKIGIEAVNW